MHVVDTLLSLIAPHACLGCGSTGALVCQWCMLDAFPVLPSRCMRCQRLTPECTVCPTCRPHIPLKHVWICTDYQAIAQKTVKALKFQRVRAAAAVAAVPMADLLPFLTPDTWVVPVPTATKRIRQRGYDQAVLLATIIAKQKNAQYCRALSRLTQTRQVGSNRKTRLHQLQNAFYVPKPAGVTGKNIILVDDVITTGATISAAARCLKQAGAKSVNAVAFAYKQ